jgi:ubiquinone/menaquinone biosynthesis C-methylase UbiE
MSDPTGRFSSRVEAYVRYRPGYPGGVIELVKAECGLTPESVVADVGSGTGILSETFLRLGCRVFGVEPNREMRGAGERLLAGHPRFESVDGRAEATTLPDSSVDFVTAGQAFHWFDRTPAREEFARILKPGGWVVLVWNKRRKTGTPLAEAYERLLLRYGTDYRAVDHENVTDDVIAAFLQPAVCRLRSFDNRQAFDYEGLEGRLMSSSYAPEPGHPNHGPMLAELRAIFDTHQRDGAVIFDYETQVYFGQLSPAI